MKRRSAQPAARIAGRATLIALAVATAAPRAARADEKDTLAEGLFRDAQTLLAEGKVHEACEKFAASQRVQRAIGTLLNLAACHEKEGKIATAWSEYADASSQASRDGDAARAGFAKRHHDALEPLLARIAFNVQTPADGETLSLDGVALPQEAWTTPLPVDPGEHSLHAAAPGRKGYDAKVEVAAATAGAPAPTQAVAVPALELAPPDVSPAPPPTTPDASSGSPSTGGTPESAPPAPRSSRSSGTRTAGLVVGIVGVVATGVGIGFLAGAQGQAGDRNAACAPGVPCPNEAAYLRASSAHDSAKTDQLVGFVVGGAGIVAIGAGAYLWLSANHTSTGARVGFAPWADPQHAGLAAAGVF